jgi:hypothetical protein
VYAWTLCGSFPFDSPPKFVGKGAQYWGFHWSRVRGVLGGNPLIPLDSNEFWWTITCLWSSHVVFLLSPKPYMNPWSESGYRSWIWASWPAGAVHPELPRRGRSDRCSWPDWPVQAPSGFCLGELVCSCGCVPWSCWSVLGLFGVGLLGFLRGFPYCRLCFGAGFCCRAYRRHWGFLERFCAFAICPRPDRQSPPAWPVPLVWPVWYR